MALSNVLNDLGAAPLPAPTYQPINLGPAMGNGSIGQLGAGVAAGLKANPDLGGGLNIPSNFAQRYDIPLTQQGQVDYSQLPAQQPPADQGASQPNLGLLDTFPSYQNALAQQQMGIAGADANLNAARQRLIINFGDPALASMAGFGLDPQAGAFAQQNYLSGNATLARLDKAHDLARRAVINQLVAHGLLNSGDLGYDEGQTDQNYGNQVYDAQQSVLSQLADLYNNYLNTRGSLQDTVSNAMNAALQAYVSNPDAYASLLGGGANGGSSGSPGSELPPGTIVDQGPRGGKNAGTVTHSYVVPGKKSPAAAMRRALGGGGRTALA